MASLFERQLATYASYHRDERNRATHFIGIPAIVFSILVPLALARSGGVSAAMVVAAISVIGWIALDRVIGLAMVVAMVPMLIVTGARRGEVWAFTDVGIGPDTTQYDETSLRSCLFLDWVESRIEPFSADAKKDRNPPKWREPWWTYVK